MTTPLQAGRLEQACPCGRWEAAGAYCSGCHRRMGPDDWYPNGDMARRLAIVGEARAAEEARPKQARRGPRNPQTHLKRPVDATGRVPADGTLFGLTTPLRSGLSPARMPAPSRLGLGLSPDGIAVTGQRQTRL